MLKILQIVIITAALSISISPTHAERRIAALSCGPHAKLIDVLKQKYNEHRTGFGVSGKHFVVETFRSADGSFTVLKTDRKGLSCIMASGHSWEQLSPTPIGPET